MQSETVNGKSLPYVLVRPDGYTPGDGRQLVVLLHGFGASMYDLAGLAPAIDSAGYVYAFPNAPYRLQVAPGMYGYSWFLGRPGVEEPAAHSPPMEELLSGFLDEVVQQVSVEPGRVVLAGFSQGGGVTLRFGLPDPDAFAGLAVLSGFFRDFDEMRSRLPQRRNQPVFLAHGRLDQMIPLERAHETLSFLEQSGYAPEYHEYDMGHEVTQPVIDDLRPWLHSVLPPG